MSFYQAYRMHSPNSSNTNLFNQIYCGDAAKILKSLPPNIVDLVVTDPPYICNYRDRINRTVANDNNSAGVMPVFDEVYRVMRPNTYCISFYGWSAISEFANAWKDAGFRIVGQIVWPKNYVSRSGFLNYRHEAAFVLAKGFPAKPLNPIDDIQDWHYSGNPVHPTQKSVEVIKPLIESFSKPGDMILDPFLGSGTTAFAAKETDRRYIGVELEKRYCEYANKLLL